MRTDKISLEERIKIQGMLESGRSQADIAQEIQRSFTTICREIRRNSTTGLYDAHVANHMALQRLDSRELRGIGRLLSQEEKQ